MQITAINNFYIKSFQQKVGVQNNPSAPINSKLSPLYCDTVSFTGGRILKIPTKRIKGILTERLAEINKLETHEEKYKLFHKIGGTVASCTSETCKSIKPYEKWKYYERDIISEFKHDLENSLSLPDKKTSTLESYMNNAIPKVIERCDFYNFMFQNNGLEGKSCKEVLNFAISSSAQKAKDKNISIKISGTKLLEEKDLKFQNIRNFQLFSVFHNIIQNALKYTPEGGSIKIMFEKYQRRIPSPVYKELKKLKLLIHGDAKKWEQRGIKFIVKDTGFGIPKAEQPKVLDGGRASNAIQSGIPGTGFGLGKVNRVLRASSYYGKNVKITSPAPDRTAQDEFPGTQITCFLLKSKHNIN